MDDRLQQMIIRKLFREPMTKKKINISGRDVLKYFYFDDGQNQVRLPSRQFKTKTQ